MNHFDRNFRNQNKINDARHQFLAEMLEAKVS